MADGWRLAESLDVLRDEVRSVAPGTTVWTIGDEDHQDEWSDHNPNAEGVVCAVDILDDAGLDLAWLAETVAGSNHPALKYVIYRDRIYIDYMASWQPYRGTWHSHVHVSVGDGPDGRSTGPYDDESPWGVGMSWDYRGRDYVNNTPSTKDHQLAKAHEYSYEDLKLTRGHTEKLEAILAAVSGDDHDAVLAHIDAHHAERMAAVDRLAAALDGLPAAVADELGDRDGQAVQDAVARALARVRVSVEADGAT